MTQLVIKFLTVQDNPAKSFAKLMAQRREELDITLDVLQERTGIKKQHLSTLERATPHSLTGKPVVPKRPTVEKIAKGLEIPLNQALEAAGYASEKQADAIPDEIKILFHGAEGWSEKKWRAVTEAIKKDIDFIDSVIPD